MAPGLFLRFVSSEVSEMIRLYLALAMLLLGMHRLPRASRLALFPFELVNTGMLPTQPEETARLKMVEEITRQRLAEAGFELVDMAPDRRAGSQGQFPTRLQRLRARVGAPASARNWRPSAGCRRSAT